MPTYVYYCESCKKEMEIFHKITEDPMKECPECGKKALERIPSAGVGLSFKGSGFYITDYGSAKSPETPACCPCGAPKSCKTE